jgi:hypothetical protein
MALIVEDTDEVLGDEGAVSCTATPTGGRGAAPAGDSGT